MKVAIFGATGIVGNAVVNEALSKGYEITILTRDARKIKKEHDNLKIIEGDVMNSETVAGVLSGQDAVIQTLGIGGKGNGKPTTFVSEANNVIMKQMNRLGLKRLVAISVIGAGESMAFLPAVYRNFILPVFMKWFKAIIDDKNRMESQIMKSNLDWTIVRCTTVKNSKSTGKVKASLDGKGLKFTISDADMASFMVQQLSDSTYIRQSPTISN